LAGLGFNGGVTAVKLDGLTFHKEVHAVPNQTLPVSSKIKLTPYMLMSKVLVFSAKGVIVPSAAVSVAL
jgi:hypothetical protein